jgi:hypothetical protein
MKLKEQAQQLLEDIARSDLKQLLVLDNQFIIVGPGGMGTHIVCFLEQDLGISDEIFMQFEQQGLIHRKARVLLPELNDVPATRCSITLSE